MGQGGSTRRRSSSAGGSRSSRRTSRNGGATDGPPEPEHHVLDPYTKPQEGAGVYTECRWDARVVRRFIRLRKLAPMFPGVDDPPTPEELRALRERYGPQLVAAGVSISIALEDPATPADGSITDGTTGADASETTAPAKDSGKAELAEVPVAPPVGEFNARLALVPGVDPMVQASLQDFEECPICMLWYPGGLNNSLCCRKGICTECFLQLKSPTGSTSCPFCNSASYAVVFLGPRTAAEITAEQDEERVIQESMLRQRLEEKERDRQRAEERKAERLAQEERAREEQATAGADENAKEVDNSEEHQQEQQQQQQQQPQPQQQQQQQEKSERKSRRERSSRRSKRERRSARRRGDSRAAPSEPNLLHVESGIAWPPNSPPAELEERMLAEAIRLSLMDQQYDSLAGMLSGETSSDDDRPRGRSFSASSATDDNSHPGDESNDSLFVMTPPRATSGATSPVSERSERRDSADGEDPQQVDPDLALAMQISLQQSGRAN